MTKVPRLTSRGTFLLQAARSLKEPGYPADMLYGNSQLREPARDRSMIEQNGSESRRYKRWDIFEYALVYQEGQQLADPAIIVDLSLGGIQVRSRTQFPAGELCLISIAEDTESSITTHAEVRYSYVLPESDLYATGFRFTPGCIEQRIALVNYIHARFQEGMDSIAG